MSKIDNFSQLLFRVFFNNNQRKDFLRKLYTQACIFSSSDAVTNGIDKRLHSRDVFNKKWLKLERGLFILPEIIDFINNDDDYSFVYNKKGIDNGLIKEAIYSLKSLFAILISLNYTQKIAQGGVHFNSIKPLLGGESAIIKASIESFIIHKTVFIINKSERMKRLANKYSTEETLKGLCENKLITEDSCISILSFFSILKDGQLDPTVINSRNLSTNNSLSIRVPSPNNWKILKHNKPRSLKDNTVRAEIYQSILERSIIDRFFYNDDKLIDMSFNIINEPFEVAILRLLYEDSHPREEIEKLIYHLVKNGDFDNFLASEYVSNEIKGYIISISLKF